MSLAARMTDMATFLAYSVALEEEAAERHDELADMMEVHNNPDVAATFRKLAGYSRLHAREIREQAGEHELPVIAPWDFGWEDMEGPETGRIDEVDYLMSDHQALQLAMGNERRAHDFYAAIGRESPNGRVREVATGFAAEEKEHLQLLQEWLDRTPATDEQARFDPDPPNMPE